ncbi:protein STRICTOSIDINE SYNTHASE-LIKE 4-like [Papaver somniferum]|uniref:protein STRICTOSIDINE SYNTHASE-LIKE 4-like n=1 Tax=Papaver somniferum TaxID=3469 RepID=UPI000E6F651D|nr:protein STRICTOSIDINE SYNTHASE-LIKE 4-like [Papaver somniferum]
MVRNRYLLALTGVVLCSFLLQTFLISNSPIDYPQVLELSPSSLSHTDLPWNNHLQRLIKLGEGCLKQPEDITVDREGVVYTATRDGWIKKIHTNGTCEDWKFIGGDTMLGVTMSITNEGDILVCDADKGLLKVNEEGVTILASEVNGSKISFADDVIEATDGSIYFSDASTKFGLHNWYLDTLEAKPNGRILKYNPSTRKTTILIDGLCFPNGVALSRDQHFLVFCESWRFRCLKYWLKGENKGQLEVFIDNLPGGPDNINLAPDGSFWIALLPLAPKGLEFIHKWPILKYMVAQFPTLPDSLRVGKRSMVVNVAADGKKIIRKFDDEGAKVIPFLTSPVEFEDHLYLGSLGTNFVGKLKLNDQLE